MNQKTMAAKTAMRATETVVMAAELPLQLWQLDPDQAQGPALLTHSSCFKFPQVLAIQVRLVWFPTVTFWT